jgi:hypothetical protein
LMKLNASKRGSELWLWKGYDPNLKVFRDIFHRGIWF